MVDLCKYKDIFGKPGQGAHSYRFAGVAIVDVAATVAVAWLTTKVVSRDGKPVTFVGALVFWLLAAVFFHWLFCVRTAVNSKLFHF